MRGTIPDHHHNEVAELDPRDELIALAQAKGQILMRYALQRIEDELVRQDLPLSRFVEEIRPHFKNNILNPAGSMIDFAKRFVSMSTPARASKSPTFKGRSV